MRYLDKLRNHRSEDEQRATGSRRFFLGRLLAGAATLAGMSAFSALSGRAEPATSDEGESRDPDQPREGDAPRRWGMTIDLDRCTGCGGCAVACKVENNVPCTDSASAEDGTGIEWMTMLPAKEGEDAFGLHGTTLPIPCMHCDDAPCVKVCPVGATYQTDDGIVAQVWDRCIGCRYCQVACPYSRRYFNWTTPEWPDSYKSFLNPDVATRPGGVVEKCTFCHGRIRDAREEARVAGEVLTDETFRNMPACAESCPSDAIVFGDLLDEDSRVRKLSRSPRAVRLLEAQGTEPKVWYLGRDRREVSS